MSAPREVIAVRPKDAAPSDLCACGALALPYAPEHRLGHAVHGALVCYHAGPAAPEDCARCGAPFNDANSTASGLCAACQA